MIVPIRFEYESAHNGTLTEGLDCSTIVTKLEAVRRKLTRAQQAAGSMAKRKTWKQLIGCKRRHIVCADDAIGVLLMLHRRVEHNAFRTQQFTNSVAYTIHTFRRHPFGASEIGITPMHHPINRASSKHHKESVETLLLSHHLPFKSLLLFVNRLNASI